ncbi:hypothetical protein PIROE2DRAFT_5803 [Piromyces sp. E2]|nr:hypothetical protein PIROE2DRAFT_5803 [Piromyces sp. E2]|eukprot:OUM66824.1 hypothetical protein PIROE2DRAFT_5803 [Piromyces sp. E2]
MSDCFYLWYFVKGFNKILKTRDWRFAFPLVAAFFAFCNNLNDIFSFLFSERHYSCETFMILFRITAAFNWTPISWLQAIRLISFTRVFYKKSIFLIITAINVLFSALYTLFYYLNLLNFNVVEIGESTDKFMFCSIKQDEINLPVIQDYTKGVMIFDICDSTFSLSVLLVTALMALDKTEHLKFHHAKIKRMIEEGLIQFIILTISKIGLYSVMFYFVDYMIVDIVWDILSVIVIICSFRLVNVKYKRIKSKVLNL